MSNAVSEEDFEDEDDDDEDDDENGDAASVPTMEEGSEGDDAKAVKETNGTAKEEADENETGEWVPFGTATKFNPAMCPDTMMMSGVKFYIDHR